MQHRALLLRILVATRNKLISNYCYFGSNLMTNEEVFGLLVSRAQPSVRSLFLEQATTISTPAQVSHLRELVRVREF